MICSPYPSFKEPRQNLDPDTVCYRIRIPEVSVFTLQLFTFAKGENDLGESVHYPSRQPPPDGLDIFRGRGVQNVRSGVGKPRGDGTGRAAGIFDCCGVAKTQNRLFDSAFMCKFIFDVRYLSGLDFRVAVRAKPYLAKVLAR